MYCYWHVDSHYLREYTSPQESINLISDDTGVGLHRIDSRTRTYQSLDASVIIETMYVQVGVGSDMCTANQNSFKCIKKTNK